MSVSITLPYIMSDGTVIDFDRTPLDTIPVGFGLAPEVKTLPAFNPDRYVRDCNNDADDESDVCNLDGCDHEYYLVTKQYSFSKYVVLPIPDLVQAEVVRSNRDDELVPDTLRAVYDDNGTLLTKQVMVDGVSGFGIETLAVDPVAALVPTFVFNSDGSATCMGDHWTLTRSTGKPVRVPCRLTLSPRDFSLQSFDLGAKKAFVSGLLEHTQEHHATVTAEQMCAHGERNFVQSTSRSTGQRFTALFCKRGQSRTACDATFLNTYGTDDLPSGLFAVNREGLLG